MLDLGLPKKVAVTGGIASGKTTVCRLFEELGAYYVSADNIVHKLLLPQTPIGQYVIDLLGSQVLVNKRISREKMAQIVFKDPVLLSQLEKRIHPEVQRSIEDEYAIVSKKNIPLFVAEVPLLFEAELESYYDFTIVVVCNEKTCISRFYDKKDYQRRSQRLIPIEEKIKKADFVIENNSSLENLRKTTQTIADLIKKSPCR